MWHIVRKNPISKEIEFLDQDRDLFYLVGAGGYESKRAALMRANKYQGNDKIYLLDARGSLRAIKIRDHMSIADQFEHLLDMEATMKTSEDPQVKAELRDELRVWTRQFVIDHGLWSLPKNRTQRLFQLIVDNDIMSAQYLYEVIKHGKK